MRFISSLLFAVLFSAALGLEAANDEFEVRKVKVSLFQKQEAFTVEQLDGMQLVIDSVLLEDSSIVNKPNKYKHRRLKAILFTLFTGPLGGHRIYLGTHQRTPIIYAITLGGFGILPVIDLIHIIFTKDLTTYDEKPQVIMWGD